MKSTCFRAAVLAASLGTLSTAFAEEPIRIGLITARSGVFALFGTSAEKGEILAAEEINKQGGVKGRQIEFISGDSKSSPEEASRLFSSAEWEAVTADAASRLSEWLNARCKEDFQRWNVLARDVKAGFGSSLIPAARTAVAQLSINPVLVDCATWDVLHAVMEAIYADCRPPRFFADLLAVYEAGHVPCSWSGSWPQGTLLYR